MRWRQVRPVLRKHMPSSRGMLGGIQGARSCVSPCPFERAFADYPQREYLFSSLKDLENPGIDEQPADGVLLRVSVAAVQLHGISCDFLRRS